MQRRLKKSILRGFTLVELLIAIVVMALLALLSWRGLDGMTRVQSQTQTHTDSVLALQAGLAQWQTDLDATIFQANVAGVSGLDFDGQVLRLTRLYVESNDSSQSNQSSTTSVNGVNGVNGASAIKDTKAESIRVVAWAKRASDTGTQWLRWQSAPIYKRAELQAAWTQAMAWAKEGNAADKQREVTVANITDWQVFILENGQWISAAGRINITAAAGLNAPTMPDSFRLILNLSPDQALVGTVTRDWLKPTLR